MTNSLQHTIEVRHKFNAAHQLPDTPNLFTKACARKHGHTYHVRVTVSASSLLDGFVVDFKKVKQAIDTLDHYDLNDILTGSPTAENIAVYLYNLISEAIEDIPGRLFVDNVKLCEGYHGEELTSWVTYGQA